MSPRTLSDVDCDVLVVGLGPVGAALAALLVRAGVKVMAIDRSTEVYPLPRAAHFDHEIMRVFQALGVADAIGLHARPAPAYEFRAADGQVLMRFDLPIDRSPSGWATGYMFNQPAAEHALRAILAASPLADIRLGWGFLGLEQDDDGVSARLSSPAGEQVVRARYLVGCDGASSRVRETLGIGLEDFRFDEPWLVVDAIVPPDARTPDINLQICDPVRPVTCVLMGPGRHRWEFMLRPGETAEQVLDDNFIRPLIEAWDCGPLEIERKAVYRFHGLAAQTWRSDRVLLAGDAAHQMPPFAGQGMCSGVRDAANLAWKLAAVIGDSADPSLLDSYQAERDPHVRALIQLAIGMGRVVCATDPAEVAARDAQMLAAQAAGAPPIPPSAPAAFGAGAILAGSAGAGAYFPQPWSQGPAGTERLDDVLGPDAWLITPSGGAPGPQGVRVVALDDPALIHLAPALIAWLDARDALAVLVRPDRYVFGTGAPEALLDAYAAQLGRAAVTTSSG
ncbi:bifunctional 3-(3-hydroxy-phenyl)propionate/3-hydroxycinnamic acid hydroxylase [Phenylobacterium aquaticum]|uniref:bifunctional 3-(3-hydroxy-phenyl)propionate/3-hydroxycinnamic acid hydroxylase MhpA n=1 Tax=Phenylobacterium aquaticum TaxID=1763816 RepID=UPI0026F278ED|nr:bifunctional 3-(3-hydroxy-phenyl)propionate/3-hydroxycinnamic acid hydroxylase [Phenylobacterium aquaticum]